MNSSLLPRAVEDLEVVRHLVALDVLSQVGLERRVVEHAGRQVVERERELAGADHRASDRREQAREIGERGPADVVGQRISEVFGELRRRSDEVEDRARHEHRQVEEVANRLAEELAEVRIVEIARSEHRELVRSTFEAADHLGRRDARGNRCREEGARGQADVDVEIGSLSIDEQVVEGLQATDLERAAGYGAAREHERDLGVRLADREVALLDDRDSHRRSSAAKPPTAPHRRFVCIDVWLRANHRMTSRVNTASTKLRTKLGAKRPPSTSSRAESSDCGVPRSRQYPR